VRRTGSEARAAGRRRGARSRAVGELTAEP
jgi:hypothetical protein